MSASVLGLRVSDTVCWPFKSGFSVAYSPPVLQELILTDFQRQILLELIFLVQVFKVRVPTVKLDSLTPLRGP